ncbi:MAG: hypothetical protein ABFC96_04695 [Thermoguttaceae bacterium]
MVGELDHFRYGYGRAGNRLWRENVVSKNMATPVYLDELYTYNGLDELVATSRGQLNSAHTAILNEVFSQDWDLDAQGNWSSFDDNGASQTRTTDAANQITGMTGGSATPVYDAAGNMTTIPSPTATDADHASM